MLECDFYDGDCTRQRFDQKDRQIARLREALRQVDIGIDGELLIPDMASPPPALYDWHTIIKAAPTDTDDDWKGDDSEPTL